MVCQTQRRINATVIMVMALVVSSDLPRFAEAFVPISSLASSPKTATISSALSLSDDPSLPFFAAS
eukprot:CAMPEP_0183714622 /NCGR_PEP_ID=MMETSP0737-20130205/9098_1 /TAXON_ID=385413 /ORGANISM="Thalassiosira miniscula, Strain CCMP1093" /LENGTH=65 /DNA_ID=CAMNT_0025943583 /DNA_START=24 /DNA_END=218 /DNA_ORIENTATION=+